MACAGPSSAFASGFFFGDNGSRALQLGGAFAGQADDLTAIQHNPAGLAQQQGFTFLLDGFGLNHDISFLRKDADGGTRGPAVTNTGGVFLLPFAAVGYGMPLGGHRFTLSAGVYGPPSVGRYTFPEPDYTVVDKDGRKTYARDPRKYAPQRYGLIENDIIILYPTLSASYELHPKVSVGASLQYVYSHLKFRIAATSILFTPDSQIEEDPAWDSVMGIDQTGAPTVTGVLGVMVRPVETVQIGLSYRPPVPIHASGQADVALGAVASQLYEVVGQNATFTMTLPQELKLGVHVQPLPALGVNVDAVYQGWQSVSEFVLTPTDIALQPKSNPDAEPTTLEAIHIPKQWHHIWSIRGGAEYRFTFGLTARAGVLWEQQASGNERLHIDFLHPTRAFITGGAEYALGPVSILLTGAYQPSQTIEVTNSEVRQANTDPATMGSVVGNGTYTTGGWIVGAGIRGSFGGGGRPATPGVRNLSPDEGVLTL